jgi:hypothetical protein
VLDVVKATTALIGKNKVGIRLSPFGVLGDLPVYPEMEADYAYLARAYSYKLPPLYNECATRKPCVG